MIVGKQKSDWFLSSVQSSETGISSSSIYAFFLAGNTVVYAPNQDTNKGNYCKKTWKAEMPAVEGNQHFCIHFFPHRTRSYHPLTENGPTWSVNTGNQSVYSRADILFYKYNYFFYLG